MLENQLFLTIDQSFISEIFLLIYLLSSKDVVNKYSDQLYIDSYLMNKYLRRNSGNGHLKKVQTKIDTFF